MLAGPEFPLWDGRAENPAPGLDLDEWLSLYQTHLETLGCTRGVIVHSIFYGTDNAVTIEAVNRLGDGFRGVGLLPDGATAADLDAFAGWDMAAVRLNYVHGGVLSWDGAKAMAPGLADRGLHIQMLAHADQHMVGLEADIMALPVDVVFDHIGWPAGPLDANSAGITALCRLLSAEKAWIKLSGLYRVCNAPYTDSDAIVAALIDANPERCLWGSDWPHIMLNGAEMPQSGALLDALDRVVPDDSIRQQILVDNPARLYRF
jgi:predicted TIM-barrel fold metal-dependent hydrolase